MKKPLKLSSFLFLMALVAALQASPVNLLSNPGFESGQAGWIGWGSIIQLSSSEAFSGNYSAHFSGSSSLEQGAIELEPGKTYKLTVWIRIQSMNGSDWGGIRFSAISWDWTQWHSSAFFSPANRPVGQWFQEIITFEATTTQYRIQAGFFGGQAWIPDFYIDELALFEELPENMAPVIHSLNLNTESGPAPLNISGIIQATDEDGLITNYLIDMGDGGVSAGQAAFSYTYRFPGSYRMIVQVADDAGARDSLSRFIHVTGEDSHTLLISEPEVPPDGVISTHGTSMGFSGYRHEGQGDIFWINNRSMQSGFLAVTNGTFSHPGIMLQSGLNLIHFQSEGHDGRRFVREIKVWREPQGYSGPRISQIEADKTGLAVYEPLTIRFDLESLAGNLFFPYDSLADTNTPGQSGLSVDAVFINENTHLVQPAFLDMPYTREGNRLIPSGTYQWKIRMAFRESGEWSCQIIARDSGGLSVTEGPMITVWPDSTKQGYIQASQSDDRYFEYDNQDLYLPMGHGTSVSGPDDTDQEIYLWRQNGLNLGRFWLSSASPFLDSWSSWATHHPMPDNGYMPPALIVWKQKFGEGQFSYRIASPAIDNQNTPAIFRGFWDGALPLKPLTHYRITARVKTHDISGPGGLVLKVSPWAGTSIVNPDYGQQISAYMRGDNPWSYLVGEWQTPDDENFQDYLYLVLEDADGEAFLDQLTIQEILADGSLKQNVLAKWNANTHLYLDPIKAREADYRIKKAHDLGIHYKIVIHEKNDHLVRHIDQNGWVSPHQTGFEHLKGSPMGDRYRHYWRHLIAKWGFATSVFSYELVNEGAPGSYFSLTDELSDFFRHKGPYPRMASTSFWSGWHPEFWAASKASYADIHAYIMTTGWIDSAEIDGEVYLREDLKNDAAAAVYAYSVQVGTDSLRNKPVIWGETDLDMPGSQAPDPLLALDTAGVWLHNFNWAHINHGGLSALIWDTQNIRQHGLFPRYREFMSFMHDIPLHTGQYQPLTASSDNPLIRVWGQVAASGKAAHFWAQNKQHRWRNIIEGQNPEPEDASIILQGLRPGWFLLEHWDTWSGDTLAWKTDSVFVENSGQLLLFIDDLEKDRAFRLWYVNQEYNQEADWPQFQRDEARTGRTSAEVSPPYRARWIWAGPDLTLRNQHSETAWSDDLDSRDGYSFPIPDSLDFSISSTMQAVVKNERLFFATLQGDAYALNVFDGETLWSAFIPGGVIVSPAVIEQTVVFAGVRGGIYAFDVTSGELIWHYSSMGAISSAPIVVNQAVIVANHRGRVLKISSAGQVLWETRLPAPVQGGMAAGQNRIYLPAEDMRVYALDLNSGAMLTSALVRGQSFRLCHPLYHDGRLYVTSVAVPMAGSEYIMEEVMSASTSLEEEEVNIKRWLQGDDNNGQWPNASEDWQHFFVLDGETLALLPLVAAGPVDGCGYPAPSPVLDNNGRILRWWKTRFPFLTAPGPAFGTNYTLDIAGVNPLTGNRIPVDNGQPSYMWPLETDNLYALSVGGNYLWLRQNFRGTQVINLNTSQHVLAQVTTRYNDGGQFQHAHICYRNTNQHNAYTSLPYLIPEQRTAGRVAPSIAGNLVFITEEFAVVAIEHDPR